MHSAVYLNTAYDCRKTAVKLHKQFSHPTSEKLIRLLRNANINSEDLEREINAVSQKCNTCFRLQKPVPRPTVSMSSTSKSNEAVVIDLKAWRNGLYYLVIVDLATRFCVAKVISDKQSKTITKAFLFSRISVFGTPKKILSDNGAEFNNDDVRQLGDFFNVRVLTTSAESPWSNSTCERLNAVIGDLVHNIFLLDIPCDIEGQYPLGMRYNFFLQFFTKSASFLIQSCDSRNS